jgi:hypothetical protein
MSTLGLVLVVVLILILVGGVGPHFYTAAPWQPGYGFGNGGIGVVGIILIIIVVAALTGHL